MKFQVVDTEDRKTRNKWGPFVDALHKLPDGKGILIPAEEFGGRDIQRLRMTINSTASRHGYRVSCRAQSDGGLLVLVVGRIAQPTEAA